MKTLGRVLLSSLLLLAAGWALLFCLANAELVALDLVVFQLPPLPAGVGVLAAFAAGGVAGLLASSLALWRGRRQ